MLLNKPGTGEMDSAASLSRGARWSAQACVQLQNMRSAFRHKWVWSIVCALTAGLALRLVWVAIFQDFDGDSEVYAILAKNLLVNHAYALDNPFHLTLIRLPGYPVFMAVIFSVFGIENYNAVCYVQAFVDMGTCLLLAGFVRDHVSRRAALVTLWIACLCPFTANYTAVPLTECAAIFCVALGLFAAGRLIQSIRSINTCASGAASRARMGWLLLTVAALICAIGLRPDGVLLWAAIVPGIWWYTRKDAPKAGLRNALLCGFLAVLPLVPWSIRNYHVYHVFQPLAPRSAMDPIESPLEGFDRWTTTWEIDYVSLGEIWWLGDNLPIDTKLLPSRAFDNEQEYRETAKLIADYNELCTITPELDARFEALAEQRIHRHPLRQYVLLPLARLADMWLRPRIEYLNDAVPERWWEWRLHPGQSLCAAAYGLLDAILLIAAAIGFARRKVPLQAVLLAYVALRCLVLLRMPNAEPRYTIEAFPIVIVAAAVAFTKAASQQVSKSAS
jgi:MFS family permease